MRVQFYTILTLALIGIGATKFTIAQNFGKSFAEYGQIETEKKPKVEIENYNFFGLGAAAANLPKPRYPDVAKSKKLSQTVNVEIVVNEAGKVIWAKALNGYIPFRKEAVRVAFLAKFSPVKKEGRPVKVSSVISYRFAPPK